AQETPTLRATWSLGDGTAAELCAVGPDQPYQRARLQADALLLGQWAQVENEIDGITNELIEAQDQLLALYDLARSTRSRLSIGEILDSLTREAARLVKTRAAAALVWMPGEAPTIVQHGAAPTDTTWFLDLFAEARRDGRHRVLERAGAEERGLPAAMRNVLLVPIKLNDQYAAALALLDKSDGPFGSPDIKLAQAIAEQVGTQIENVRLYQEKLAQTRLETEMALARRVQMHLLPQHLPLIAGLDVYARTLPALQVGGDFYDLIHPAGGPYMFVVGDVSGKGISAALIMAMTRTVLRSASRAPARGAAWPTPAQIMSRATDELYDDLTEVGMFVTIFFGQYDPAERRLRYANLGHSPVIYRPTHGTPRLLEADGPALGMLPVNLAEDQELAFGPDDLLLVATDGFNEARNAAGEMFGYERLLALVQEFADHPATAIADRLYERVAGFSAGHGQDDDQTLIILKGTANAGERP
ncbi:MAG: PP2C family protein-serine/threonine phosphatase, partial [Anaerolineae bacterium]|nr:PP2C family protein-serine/threonine phosphatase [Anaerolineae bacterium]